MTDQQPVPDGAKLTDEELADKRREHGFNQPRGQISIPGVQRMVADAATEKAWAYLLNMAGEDRNMEGKELQAFLRGRFSEEEFIHTLVKEHEDVCDAAHGQVSELKMELADLQRQLAEADSFSEKQQQQEDGLREQVRVLVEAGERVIAHIQTQHWELVCFKNPTQSLQATIAAVKEAQDA